MRRYTVVVKDNTPCEVRGLGEGERFSVVDLQETRWSIPEDLLRRQYADTRVDPKWTLKILANGSEIVEHDSLYPCEIEVEVSEETLQAELDIQETVLGDVAFLTKAGGA